MGGCVEIEWSRGFTYKELLGDESLKVSYTRERPIGVYVHLDHRKGRVAYVGKTEGSPSLWMRQFQHYVNTIGGLYLIPSVSKDGDYVWRPGPDVQETIEAVLDPDKYRRVAELAFEYVQHVRIHLCPLPDTESAKRVERELIYWLQPLDTVRGTKSAPDSTISLVHLCSQFPELSLLSKKDRPNHILQPLLP